MRIRTIKPEFFIHSELFDLEEQTKLPIRISFVGLWCAADREGRFRWKPRELKTKIIPYDNCDFSRVLDALTTRGFLVKYASQGDEFGFIPSFLKHQVINNREMQSSLPNPTDSTVLTRAPRVDHACPTPLCNAQGEYGIGNMEVEYGNGKGTNFKDSTHDRYKGGVGEDRDGACAPAIENGSGSIEGDPKDAAAMSRRLDDKNAPERPKRLKVEAYHEHSRTVLHYLNQATGRNYRELAANLDPISARLNEPGVDLEGVKTMIDRQVKLWGGTEMQEYLKPTTLFRLSKFDGYYASRLVEISRPKTAFEKMCPPPLHDWSKEEGGEIDFASISQEVQ